MLVDPQQALLTDDPLQILEFAISTFRSTGGAALATLVDIRGGAAKAIGAQIAIGADGRYAGYVSGGCVEAAVAAEAIEALDLHEDRTVTYGEGSPFFDIVLPCGGGITIAIHCLRSIEALEDAVTELHDRRPATLRYCTGQQTLAAGLPAPRSLWEGDDFLIQYRPRTRIVVSGQSVEAAAVSRMASAAGYDVVAAAAGRKPFEPADIDPFTAVVLLHHDIDAELPILEAALQSTAFYVGALGSTRTHRRREERLRFLGYNKQAIERIRAPIGLFGPAKDSSSLAMSVLADVAAARLVAYP